MPWAVPRYRSDLADECGRGQNSLRRRLEALGWSRLALPSPDDQSGTIAHQRAVVEIQGWSTPRVGHRTKYRCSPQSAAGKTPTALRFVRIGVQGGQRNALATGRSIGTNRHRRPGKTPTALRIPATKGHNGRP